MCGNYSREEIIQGRILYEEIRYIRQLYCFYLLHAYDMPISINSVHFLSQHSFPSSKIRVAAWHWLYQWCRNWGGWGGPPIFGRSVNPIPTGGGQIIPTYYYWPPQSFSPSDITGTYCELDHKKSEMYLTRGIKRDQKMWNAMKLKSMIYFLRNYYDLYCFQVCCCRSKIRWGRFNENHGSFKDLNVNSSWTFNHQWGSLWNSSEYMSNLLWDQTQVRILCFKFSLTRGTDTKMTKVESWAISKTSILER